MKTTTVYRSICLARTYKNTVELLAHGETDVSDTVFARPIPKAEGNNCLHVRYFGTIKHTFTRNHVAMHLIDCRLPG